MSHRTAHSTAFPNMKLVFSMDYKRKNKSYFKEYKIYHFTIPVYPLLLREKNKDE